MTYMALCIKNCLKIFFFGTNQLGMMKYDVGHRGLEAFELCSNDDPNLSELSVKRSDLFPYNEK